MRLNNKHLKNFGQKSETPHAPHAISALAGRADLCCSGLCGRWAAPRAAGGEMSEPLSLFDGGLVLRASRCPLCLCSAALRLMRFVFGVLWRLCSVPVVCLAFTLIFDVF